MNRIARRAAMAAVALMLLVTASQAAPINYGDFNGVLPGEVDFLQVTEDSATDATPLYDAPFHLPNNLIFAPQTFAATAAGGSTDTTTGTLTMGIRADAGQFLQYIILRELGDYTLSGLGTSATSADVSGLLTVQNIIPGGSGPFGDVVDFTPAPPYSLSGDLFAEFAGTGVINLNGLGISEVFLTLDNTLSASSEAGTTSFIQKKVIRIEHSPIPEPATLSMLLAGVFAVVRRRRIG